MTTHVFIVDWVTLKYHLEYQFVGTGAKDNVIDFNSMGHTNLHYAVENMLCGMMADASRVRKDDLIIFYLQQNSANKIPEGKFFGIFQACNDWSFLDNNDNQQFLKTELNKPLTFRALIKPFHVYAEGVTEWEALDDIQNIQAPNQMLWSLIYRKLKGNRGNTMITLYESERLCQLIRNKNNRTELECVDKKLSYDVVNQNIICIDGEPGEYAGRKEEINLLPRLIQKFIQGQAFETHLQAYIVKAIGKNINHTLDRLLIGNKTVEWLGNEVSCGVGMQRIDIMLSLKQNDQRICVPIELKAVEASKVNIIQIQRYVDWIKLYYTPNIVSDIEPVLISKKIDNKERPAYAEIVETFNSFNDKNQATSKRLRFIEYYIENNDIVFEEVVY